MVGCFRKVGLYLVLSRFVRLRSRAYAYPGGAACTTESLPALKLLSSVFTGRKLAAKCLK